MRTSVIALAMLLVSFPLSAQTDEEIRERIHRPPTTGNVETIIKDARLRFGEDRKIYERDLEVLGHLTSAVEGLSNEMQKGVALINAHEHLEKARSLPPDIRVMHGLMKSIERVEDARRSPATADLDALQSFITAHAVRPARDVVADDALQMQDEALQWLRIHELVSIHIRDVSMFTQEVLVRVIPPG